MIFTGSAVAILTPFVEGSFEIDWDSFDKLLDFHLINDTDALVITGTTGESSTLTDDEQIELIKFAVDKVAGRKAVIAGTGINDTRHTIYLSQEAEKVGADALLIVTPYYNKTSYNGMIAHFTAIADSVNLPIILYHVPSRTGASLSPEQVSILSQHKNIVALKDAAGDLDYTQAVMDSVSEDFAIYSGNDDLTNAIMQMGGHGTISVTANILPNEIHQLCQYNLDGQTEEANKLNEALDPINSDLFVEVNPIPVKYIAHKLDLCSLVYRLPLVPPAEETMDILDDYIGMTQAYKQ